MTTQCASRSMDCRKGDDPAERFLSLLEGKSSFSITTFGCKVNQYESQALRAVLIRRGLEECPAEEGADLLIVNTCTVTGTSESKCRRAVQSLRRRFPESAVVAAGCKTAPEVKPLAVRTGLDVILGGALSSTARSKD